MLQEVEVVASRMAESRSTSLRKSVDFLQGRGTPKEQAKAKRRAHKNQRHSMALAKPRKKMIGLPLLDGDSDASSDRNLTWKDDWPKIARNLVDERCEFLQDQQRYLRRRDFHKEVRDAEGTAYSKLKIGDV